MYMERISAQWKGDDKLSSRKCCFCLDVNRLNTTLRREI